MKNEAEIHEMGFELGLAKPANMTHAAEIVGAIKAVSYILGMSRLDNPETDWRRFLSGWEHELTKGPHTREQCRFWINHHPDMGCMPAPKECETCPQFRPLL